MATDFSISEAFLHKWIKAVDATQSGNLAGSTKFLKLQRELRRARQEIEILRRAAAYFALDVIPTANPTPFKIPVNPNPHLLY